MKKNEYKWYPLLYSTYRNDIEMVKLLIEYANKNNIALELNDKNIQGHNPLIWAILRNNIEMVQLLIDYANKNDIVLEINEKNNDGVNPIFWAIDNNNLEIFRLLVEYSVEKILKIIINEKDIEELISKNEIFIHLKNISEINPEFLKLIYLYRKKNIIEVIFSENSYILKKIIEYIENEKNEKKRKMKD